MQRDKFSAFNQIIADINMYAKYEYRLYIAFVFEFEV